jgi:hypothetical protein
MTNDYLANRYGKSKAKARNQRFFWTAIGIALTVGFFAWSISINFGSSPNLTAAVQNFSVVDDLQTQVTIKITNDAQQDGVCAVQVLSKSFAVVGYKELVISGDLGKTPVIDVAVNTTNTGVSATVDRCWFK